nr:MAG TPA: hypothetical protein [Caudoviricetes sp.]
MKRLHFAALVLLFLVLLPTAAYAHPGDTDSSGGHYDSSTGEYHYHHGYPAHQHTNGQCPYDFDNQTGWNSGSSGSSSGPLSKSSFLLSLQDSPILIVVFISTLISVLSIIFCLPFSDNYAEGYSRTENHFDLSPKYTAIIFTCAFANFISAVAFACMSYKFRGFLLLVVIIPNYIFWGTCAYLRYWKNDEHTYQIKRKIGLVLSAFSLVLCCIVEFELIFAIIISDIFIYAAIKLPSEYFFIRNAHK